mmetsp:Transcript_11030/g.13623  ORF Transcript_11030/g.13623 Transcript_11030/m.13623 type:complete len:273 (-) Transcript_11030:22-840(-)
MRFKTKIVNVPLFTNIVQTLEKVHKGCVMHLTTEKIEFILASEMSDGLQVWGGINVASLFEDYRIESMNNNELSFEIILGHIHKALKSAQFATDVTMKLTKNQKGLPVLSISIITQTMQTATIVQEVPIQVISAAQLSNLKEPPLPNPEVYILMPQLKLVQRVVDRMKNVSATLKIEANMAGTLKLSVCNEATNISTLFHNLEHPQIEDTIPPRSADIQAEVSIDIKKFIGFLHTSLIRPANVILCICEERALVLHVLLDDLYMSYFLSVLI